MNDIQKKIYEEEFGMLMAEKNLSVREISFIAQLRVKKRERIERDILYKFEFSIVDHLGHKKIFGQYKEQESVKNALTEMNFFDQESLILKFIARTMHLGICKIRSDEKEYELKYYDGIVR